MTAPLRSPSLESASVGRLFSPRSIDSVSSRPALSRRPLSSVSSRQQLCVSPKTEQAAIPELDLLWSSLIESLQQGVIVVSHQLKPIYWNLKSQQLCKNLPSSKVSSLQLPVEVSEICHRLIRNQSTNHAPHSLMMECQSQSGQTIRISVRWLHLAPAPISSDRSLDSVAEATQLRGQSTNQPAYILVFLESCNDILQEELRIEQKKYDLTEREAEVWMLLRQEYTYQEIAKMLQISLNTVKTHVKNVYAKKRSCQGQEKFWWCE